MLFILNKTNSIGNRFLAEMRDVNIQQDRMRFRRNQERLGEILAYEISKKSKYELLEVQTPLGTCNVNVPTDQPVIATILRAGLPLQQGFLNFFDQSQAAFITAYRKVKKSGDFIIKIDHISTPNLDGATIILCDTMLATGQSIVQVCKELIATYDIKAIHIASVIASTEGIDHVRANLPKAHLWVCAVDEEMTTKAYIVPGLGDAGDLAFGEKV
ncbi:uracil phosphoribosyltransferase [Mucilaginibacter myungsuensis]|uniref:Uracil phosphoribosyltransferase n=1 Tax=Mucilaginibacter myungsuensis TaxID=649104 RepID=A0A929KU07_9SPHI|nr:uracil phosphoribosyltransferase [Mucilaginibacter myungsuensis]MBE9661167.1 uracil phosphoribosyltransferase [Mucilaginibacter myungsuensis]MDN3597312.1 uracil phosphoribosyltransferase [Mucilaginibacter myungsuensis]